MSRMEGNIFLSCKRGNATYRRLPGWFFRCFFYIAFPIYRSMPLKRLIKSPFLLLSLPSSSIYYRCINVIKSPFEFLERNVLRIPSILIILRLLITSPVNSLSFFSQFQFRDNPFQPESTRFSKSLASYFSLYLFIYFFFIKFSVTQSE